MKEAINGPESFEVSFTSAQSFDELFEMMRSMGDIKGSAETYPAEDIISIINVIRAGRTDLMISVTRSFALRETVARLLEKEQSETTGVEEAES